MFATTLALLAAAQPLRVAAAVPSPSDTLSLEDCLRIALEHQPGIASAAAARDVAGARAGQGLAAALPNVSASANYSRSHTDIPGEDTTPSSNNYAGNLSVRQRLFDFGSTLGNIRAVNRTADAVGENLRAAQLDVVQSVRQAYYSLLKTRALVRVAEDAKEQKNQHLRQARAFFEVGTRPKFDVTRAEADFTSAELDQLKARNNELLAAVSLARAVGLPEMLDIRIRDLEGPPVAPDLDAAAEWTRAQQLRPDVAASELRLQSTRASATAAFGGFFPVLEGTASYGYLGAQFPLEKTWRVGLTASMPLFDGGATLHRVAEARASVRVSEADLASVKLRAREEVEQAALNYTVARDNIRVTAKLLEQATENLAVAEGRYRAGAGSIIEVTDAQVLLTSARTQSVQSRYDLEIARAALDHATGRDPGPVASGK